MKDIKADLKIKTDFFNKLLSSRKIINPKREWMLLLAFFLILIISFVSFDFITYKKISSGEMYISINRLDLNIEVLKTDALKKLIDNFESRKAKITSLKVENLIDPSL